jgi:decaprenylphospho-beta-D-erythro-pentofuranosid-2-ulose 2-reductase
MKKVRIKKIVVLGATSGIAQPLLRMMAREGKEFLLVARSQERLDAVRTDLLARGAPNVLTFEADLVTSQELVVSFAKECFPDFDTLLLAYGSMLDQALCQISAEHAVRELETNLVSAVALLTRFAQYFEARRSGTVAVITSVAGDRGRRSNYVYGAAKGGLSIFLQGLRGRMYQHGVRVLTIKPGPVATQMTANMRHLPLLSTPEIVAKGILRVLESSRGDVIYTPARWRWIMGAVRLIPERYFKRLSV